jgi:hypothetical protein
MNGVTTGNRRGQPSRWLSGPTLVTRLLPIVPLAALALFHIRRVLSASIYYDDAYIATVAKNLAWGFGYATSYPHLVPFDPDISTGPTVVLPAALLISLFGNGVRVPNIAAMLAIWTTLALVVRLLYRRYSANVASVALAVFATTLLISTTEEFGLLGEVPAGLLVVAAALLVASPRARPSTMAAAGLLSGLAVMAKLISLFAVPVLVAATIVLPLTAAGERVGLLPRIRRAAAAAAGVAVPFLLWQLWTFLMLGASEARWLDANIAEWKYLAGSNSLSGAGQIRDAAALAYLWSAAARNAHLLVESSGGLLATVAWIAAATVSAAYALRLVVTRRQPSGGEAALILLGAGLLHFFWWVAISPTGWYRHLLPAVIYAGAGTALAAALGLYNDRRVGIAILILVTGGIAPRARVLLRPFTPLESAQRRVDALVATRDRVVELASRRDVVLVGCGWWVPRDLEYLLPSVGNFQDCWDLGSTPIEGKRVLLVRNEFFNWDRSPALDDYRQRCDRRIIFEQPPFVISECPGRPH